MVRLALKLLVQLRRLRLRLLPPRVCGSVAAAGSVSPACCRARARRPQMLLLLVLLLVLPVAGHQPASRHTTRCAWQNVHVHVASSVMLTTRVSAARDSTNTARTTETHRLSPPPSGVRCCTGSAYGNGRNGVRMGRDGMCVSTHNRRAKACGSKEPKLCIPNQPELAVAPVRCNARALPALQLPLLLVSLPASHWLAGMKEPPAAAANRPSDRNSR